MRDAIKGSAIIGRAVQTHTGVILGRVTDLLVRRFDGQLTHVVIKARRRLGLEHRRYAIPWEHLHLTYGLAAVVSNDGVADLAAAPASRRAHDLPHGDVVALV